MLGNHLSHLERTGCGGFTQLCLNFTFKFECLRNIYFWTTWFCNWQRVAYVSCLCSHKPKWLIHLPIHKSFVNINALIGESACVLNDKHVARCYHSLYVTSHRQSCCIAGAGLNSEGLKAKDKERVNPINENRLSEDAHALTWAMAWSCLNFIQFNNQIRATFSKLLFATFPKVSLATLDRNQWTYVCLPTFIVLIDCL